MMLLLFFFFLLLLLLLLFAILQAFLGLADILASTISWFLDSTFPKKVLALLLYIQCIYNDLVKQFKMFCSTDPNP